MPFDIFNTLDKIQSTMRNIEKEWRPEWVKPEGNRRKGLSKLLDGDPGDFESEEDYRRTLSRRQFLKLAGKASPVIFFGGLAGAWWLRAKAEDIMDEERQANWAPKVRELLLDTLQSERMGNLAFLNDYVREDIVQMTAARQAQLMSPNQEERNRARWEIAQRTLTVQYQFRVNDYEAIKDNPIFEDYFKFLDMTVGQIDPDIISRHNPEQQANMWVEAHSRAYSASWDLDPTLNDGVYFPESQSLIGHAFLPQYRFIPLQRHP